VALPPRIYCECTFVLHVVSVAKKYRAATMHPLRRGLQLLRPFVLDASGSASSYLSVNVLLRCTLPQWRRRTVLLRCIHSGDGFVLCVESVVMDGGAASMHTLGIRLALLLPCVLEVSGACFSSIVNVLLRSTLHLWFRWVALFVAVRAEVIGALRCILLARGLSTSS
jgi:hypothetical protein